MTVAMCLAAGRCERCKWRKRCEEEDWDGMEEGGMDESGLAAV